MSSRVSRKDGRSHRMVEKWRCHLSCLSFEIIKRDFIAGRRCVGRDVLTLRFSRRFHRWRRFFRFSFVVSKIIYIFAASFVSPVVGERAVLYMRKTFSNVWRCESWISQIPKPQQTDDNETSTCGAYLYTIYIVRSGVGWWALSILCGKAMREPTIPGWAEEQTPTPFLCI